jgi:hypothetical protein
VFTYAGGEIAAVREWLTTRWYAPLLVLGVLMVALLVGGLAVFELLAADVPSAVAPLTWSAPLSQAEAAIDRGDVATALSAWREAYAAAVRSGQWEGMVAVGDTARRLEHGPASQGDALGRARQAYLTALFRARREHSVEGALRAAVAFGELGDRDVLTLALRIAEQQAGRDPLARARVRDVANRWMGPRDADRRDLNFRGGSQP